MLELPTAGILEESKYPTPEEYTFWQSYKNRTFYIDYEIGEGYELVELGKQIIQMNMEEMFIAKEQLKPIYLFVYSYGGDLEQTYGLIGIIESSRIPIITINMGVAMSAGFLLLLSGHHRYTFKHSTAMVHQGKAGFSGTPDEIAEAQKSYNKQLDRMKSYILSRTMISEKEFNKKRKNDWYLTDNEQVKYGVVDSIINDFSQLYEPAKHTKPYVAVRADKHTADKHVADKPKHKKYKDRTKEHFGTTPAVASEEKKD